MGDKNEPTLRFPGFIGEWKQYRLCDLQEENKIKLKRGNIIPKQKGQYPVYSSSSAGDGLFCTADSFMFDDEKVTWSIDGGGRVFYRPKHKFSVTNVCGYVDILTDKLDCKFLALSMERAWSQTTFDYITKAHPSVISNLYTVFIPDIEEQRKIGEFFKDIDRIILLQQQKLDRIREYKDGMIQKLFPREGQSIPESRFPEYKGEWKEYKLGEIYTERNEKGNDSLQFLTVSIHSGVSDEELDEEELGKTIKRSKDKSTYKHTYSGDLVFNMMRAWQGAIGVVKNEGMISPAYISAIPNEIVYPLFMDYALRRKEAIDQINNLSYGVTDFRKRLYWSSFVNVKCMLPSREEQERIWKFLKQYDDLIELYQKKIKALQKYKKGLFQQMFI